jgi:hypothetical protein
MKYIAKEIRTIFNLINENERIGNMRRAHAGKTRLT